MQKIAKPASLEMQHDTSVTWRHFAPVGVTLEDVTDENYFQNNIRECGMQRVTGRAAWNKIEVLAIDGSWEAELRIVSVDGLKVHTRVLRYWSVEDKQADKVPARRGRVPNLPAGYTTEYVDQNGWRVVDGVGNIIAEKLNAEEDALRAAYAHSKPKAA